MWTVNVTVPVGVAPEPETTARSCTLVPTGAFVITLCCASCTVVRTVGVGLPFAGSRSTTRTVRRRRRGTAVRPSSGC